MSSAEASQTDPPGGFRFPFRRTCLRHLGLRPARTGMVLAADSATEELLRSGRFGVV